MRPVILGIGSCIVGHLVRGLRFVIEDARYHYNFKVIHYRPNAKGEALPKQLQPELLERTVLCIEELLPWSHRELAMLTDEHRAILARRAVTITLPTLHLNSLWPLIGHDPRNQPEPGYPWGRYPGALSDRLALGLMRRESDLRQRISMYKKIAINDVIDLDRFHQMQAIDMFEREAKSDLKAAAFVLSQFQRLRLFFTHSHPSGDLYQYLMTQLLGHSGFNSFYKCDWGKVGRKVNAWRSVLEREDLAYEEAVIHPQIAKHFDLRWWSPELRYTTPLGTKLSYDEWLERYMA